MTVQLEGGCFVSNMREVAPVVTGTLSRRDIIGSQHGAQSISLSILEYAPGLSPGLCAPDSDHILYRLETSDTDHLNCKVFIDGWTYDVGPQTGVYVTRGQTMFVDNRRSEPVVFISTRCPDAELMVVDQVPKSPEIDTAGPRQTIRLSNRSAIPTANRWYRVLVDDELGSMQVTQFVGAIPPGRAPDHFHNYEEVLFILRGVGRMWAGQANTSIGAGSCIYLPRGQVHCVENTGTDELRLLGVFYPAGSPAVRYEG
jgi:mannose-6-phosphate isomerase-like protein (cupin superfamily)